MFICFSTKAVHLEAVSDLSSNAFIAALKRFVGCRGCPLRIFCDNATNFVGARNELYEIQRNIKEKADDISEFCVSNNIDWKFIPAASPHMRSVGSRCKVVQILFETCDRSKFVNIRRIGHSLNTD